MGAKTETGVQRTRRAPVIVILIACGTFFAYRGPFRALTDHGINDLFSPYLQSMAWVRGLDPYSPQSLLAMWPAGGPDRPDAKEFADGSIVLKHGIPTAYPATSFLILAPLTLLSWPVAKLLWLGASLALFLLAIWSLIRVAKLQGRRRTIFIGMSLLLAPFHTGL